MIGHRYRPSALAFCVLYLRGYSIATPSLLHRKSIVSMEYRWTNDGDAMDLWRRNRGGEGGDSDQDELKDKSRYSNTRLKKCFDNTDKCYYL